MASPTTSGQHLGGGGGGMRSRSPSFVSIMLGPQDSMRVPQRSRRPSQFSATSVQAAVTAAGGGGTLSRQASARGRRHTRAEDREVLKHAVRQSAYNRVSNNFNMQ